MIKRMPFIVVVLMMFALTACGGPTTTETPSEISPETPTMSEQNNTPLSESTSNEILSENPSETPTSGDQNSTSISEPTSSEMSENSEVSTNQMKILIAYFSSSGNIVTDEEPRGNVGHGNTKTVADLIQGQVGGSVFFIETVDKYPANYNDTIDVAMQEQRADARPALASHVENMADYDVIFLGYPNWWGTMPQAVFTFLDEYDFSGKTVIPFCTHEGSGFGRSVNDLQAYIPDALFLEGFSVRGSSAGKAEEDIKQWISELNLES